MLGHDVKYYSKFNIKNCVFFNGHNIINNRLLLFPEGCFMDIPDIFIYLSKGYKVMLSNIFSHGLLLGILSCYNRKQMESYFND